MKKIILVMALIISLAFVIADESPSLQTWNSKVELTKEQADIIKSDAKITAIDITISPIECDDVECWAIVHQKGVINSEWRAKKTYKNCTKEGYECTPDKEYTITELKNLALNYANKKLSGLAHSLIVQEEKQEYLISGEGKIDEKR